MNRRAFLLSTAAAIGGAAFGQGQEAKPKRKIKKAVNLNMVKGNGSVSDKFKLIQDAGFDGVELNRPDAIPLDDLIQARDGTGLTIAGVICSTHWGKPLTANEPAIREQGMRGLKLALQDSGELGCDRLLLVPGVVDQNVSYADAWTRSLAAIKEAVPVAAKVKCKIAIENVWNNFLLSPLEAARFVDEINGSDPNPAAWVGWHFDIGNIVAFGWPEQWIRVLGKRILNLHIKEFSRKKRDNEGLGKGFNVELGEGDVGWPAVMQALDEIGYEGYGILEVPGGDAARLKFLAERTDQLLAS